MATICPLLLANGTCSNTSCTHLHDIEFCDSCGVKITSPDVRASHFSSRKHQANVSGARTLFYCSTCDKHVTANAWQSHLKGQRHARSAKSKNIPTAVDPQRVFTDIPGQRFCDLCRIHIPSDKWRSHTSTRGHKRQEAYATWKAVLDEGERDKNGVVIEGTFDFGIITPEVGTASVVSRPMVKVTIPHAKIVLVEVALASRKTRNNGSPFSVTFEGQGQISYSKPINLNATFKQLFIGRYQDRAEFTFEDVQLKKQFIILRPLRAIVGSQNDHQLLAPRAPYIPRARIARQLETNVVEGVEPPSLKAIPYVFKLPKAEIPKSLRSTLSANSTFADSLGQVRKVFLPPTLDSETYGRHFKYLLWLEEFQMDMDMERYDLSDVTLGRHNSYYYLQVPGLAEKRPSVLVGDRILVQKQGAPQGHWYEGRVHVVRQAEVGLRFHSSFGWSQGQHYNVRFKLNRIPMRRQHQAMDTAFAQLRVLFPVKNQLPRALHLQKTIKLFNHLLASNSPQLLAVSSILSQPPGSVPFVIFGPPGTGKTVTAVEAILQLVKGKPDAKVLACAPSNSAADLIASRLRLLGTDELFRFYAPSRHQSQVPDELLPYTYIRNGGSAPRTVPDGQRIDAPCFSVPPLARMKRFRVVVTTCISASVVSGIGLPRGHYSHIFVDEAGQATEPEVFVAIKTMADNNTNVILSGDPKQLGPIIRSSIARSLGLEKSYIERMMDRDAYDIQTAKGLSVVKLVQNFRSHNAILCFPNEKFYAGELEQCANANIINSFLGSVHLPAKKFPIIFHGVSGKDDREATSPSFFNIDEASQVKAYVQALRADRQTRTTENDIGIITPYHAQCLKIRAILRGVADGIKVGSVEEFQGQERRVIIISTVRSSKEFVEYDLRHTLGFVANPRRFNVAVTRAQALLIVIGDPQVLSIDPLWRSFLNYVYVNKGWTGQPITWDPRIRVSEEGGYDHAIREAAKLDMNDLARRMEAVSLTNVGDAEDAEGNVDRPWRDTE